MARLALALSIVLTLAAAAPAAAVDVQPPVAVDRYVPMKVPPGPGPAKYDRVFVKQIGPLAARNVLVLVPGTNGGAGGIVPVARDIVRRVPKTQVWIVDRREQAFEDTSVFASANPQRAQDYYLGFQYRRVAGEDAKFAADWGLKLQLADLRSVIRRARAGGRRVFLGGHSAGASTAVAYAAWDFGGRPGYRDLDGLVLIDGGLLGSFASADLARAKRELADIRTGKVFLDLLGTGLPEINGIFAQVGALWAYKRPDEPSVLQEYPLLPDFLKPDVPRHERGGVRVRVRRDHVAGLARADPDPRGTARRQRRPPRLAGRRDHADPAPRAGLRRGPSERDRVVLPAPPAARLRRRQPDAPDAGREVPRPAADARERDRPAALRVQHRTHARARGARREAARGALEDRGVPPSSTTAGRATSTRSRPRRPRTTS